MNHEEFGQFLTKQRELRGLSREEVSRVTKIPPTLLEALEEGDVRRLPGRVFVLHYIRSYAEVIGMEPSDAVLRYEEIEPQPSEPASVVVSRNIPWLKIALGVFAGLVLLFLLLRLA